MTILTYCPNCKRAAKVPRDAAGKTVRCTGCKSTFVVPPGSGELTVEWGPIGAGRKVSLRPGRTVTIGRTRDNAVCLAGPLVSRRHAALDWVESEWRLRDAGSTNGTFVNGQRIHDIGLTDGSRIVIGDFALRLVVATTGPSDVETALDAMAVEGTKAGIPAFVERPNGRGGPADSGAETAMGEVALSGPAEREPAAASRRRRLHERWGVVVAMVVLVIVAVAVLIGSLI